MEYRERYEGWLSDPYFDEATKEELRSMIMRLRNVFTGIWNSEQPVLGESSVQERTV